MEFEEKLNQEQHEVNNAAVVRIEQLQSDLKQKEAQYELLLNQKEEPIEQIQVHLLFLEMKVQQKSIVKQSTKMKFESY